MKKLSIIIPAYNEAPTIHLILDRVRHVQLVNNIEKEIVIVNDCSKDNTADIVRQYIEQHPGVSMRLHNQPVNQGKGAAIHKGIARYTYAILTGSVDKLADIRLVAQ